MREELWPVGRTLGKRDRSAGSFSTYSKRMVSVCRSASCSARHSEHTCASPGTRPPPSPSHSLPPLPPSRHMPTLTPKWLSGRRSPARPATPSVQTCDPRSRRSGADSPHVAAPRRAGQAHPPQHAASSQLCRVRHRQRGVVQCKLLCSSFRALLRQHVRHHLRKRQRRKLVPRRLHTSRGPSIQSQNGVAKARRSGTKVKRRLGPCSSAPRSRLRLRALCSSGTLRPRLACGELRNGGNLL